LLTRPACEANRSIFLTNRVPPEYCPVSQPHPADDSGGEVGSGKLLDEFTFSFTDSQFERIVLNLSFPRNAEPTPRSPFLTNRKIAGDLCPGLTSNQIPNINS
jgi:hypothetical protein